MKLELSYKQLSCLCALLDLEISDIKKVLTSDVGQTFKAFYSQELSDYVDIYTVLSTALLSD